MEIDITLLAARIKEWALEVGEIQLSYFRSDGLAMETKSSLHDVVTAADKACEKFISEKVRAFYPDHSFLGEEGADYHGTSDYSWVVDPLDGTNNFSQGLPIFCTSIGVAYKGAPIAGVVYLPYLKELFTATRGGGAYFNGTPIRIGTKTDLAQSMLATGFPYDKDVNPDNNVDNVASILPHVRGLRRMGAAAYDLCCVAAGWLDGYWEFNLQPWDVAAATLIIEEAGGIVVPFRENRGIAIVAGNEALVAQIHSMIK